jgi:hypothetical protein
MHMYPATPSGPSKNSQHQKLRTTMSYRHVLNLAPPADRSLVDRMLTAVMSPTEITWKG